MSFQPIKCQIQFLELGACWVDWGISSFKVSSAKFREENRRQRLKDRITLHLFLNLIFLPSIQMFSMGCFKNCPCNWMGKHAVLYWGQTRRLQKWESRIVFNQECESTKFLKEELCHLRVQAEAVWWQCRRDPRAGSTWERTGKGGWSGREIIWKHFLSLPGVQSLLKSANQWLQS